jgi:hypothetical protein
VIVHVDILESNLVCLFGCTEVSSDVCAFYTWPDPSLMVGQQKEGTLLSQHIVEDHLSTS